MVDVLGTTDKLKLPPKTTNYTVYLITKPIISYYEKKNCKFKFKKRGKITVRHTFFGVVQIEY